MTPNEFKAKKRPVPPPIQSFSPAEQDAMEKEQKERRTTMVDTMKCPFREKDGEFFDCYGKECMAYYEWPSSVSSLDAKPMKMCRKIMQQYPSNFIQHQYPTFNPYSNYNFYGQGVRETRSGIINPFWLTITAHTTMKNQLQNGF